jgi:hypothetical protein
VPRLRTGRRGFDSWLWQGYFLFATASRPSLWSTRPPIQRYLGQNGRGAKLAAYLQLMSRFRNAWDYTSTSPVHLYGVVLDEADDTLSWRSSVDPTTKHHGNLFGSFGDETWGLPDKSVHNLRWKHSQNAPLQLPTANCINKTPHWLHWLYFRNIMVECSTRNEITSAISVNVSTIRTTEAYTIVVKWRTIMMFRVGTFCI